MKNKPIIVGAVALIIGLALGYFGSTALAAPAKSTTARGSFAAGAGGFTRTGGNTAAGGFLTGTVAATDSGSITLNTRDGSSHVVLVTPDTSVSKSVSGTLADVAVGSTVIVSGTTNSDGSVSATLVQIRPAMPNAPVTQTPAQN